MSETQRAEDGRLNSKLRGKEVQIDVRSFESCQQQPGLCYPGAGGQGDLGDVTSAPGFPQKQPLGEIGEPGLLSYSQLGWTRLEVLGP